MTLLRVLRTRRARAGFVRGSVLLVPLLLATVPTPADLSVPRGSARAGSADPEPSRRAGLDGTRPAGDRFEIDAAWLEGDSHYGPLSTPAAAGVETSPLVRRLAGGGRRGPSALP